jgi:hypothetical protein
VLVDEWVGKPRSRDARSPEEAWAELARRYLGAHEPANADDFAAWCGVPMGKARRAFELIAGELAEVRVGGSPAWVLARSPGHGEAGGAEGGRGEAGGVARGRSAAGGARVGSAEGSHTVFAAGREPAKVGAAGARRPASGGPCVRLLPAFDSYLLGYRRRDFALPPPFARRIQAGGGWIHPAVLVDGRVAATWRRLSQGKRLAIEVQPFEPLAREILPYIEQEAEDIGRFLGAAVTMTIQD